MLGPVGLGPPRHFTGDPTATTFARAEKGDVLWDTIPRRCAVLSPDSPPRRGVRING